MLQFMPPDTSKTGATAPYSTFLMGDFSAEELLVPDGAPKRKSSERHSMKTTEAAPRQHVTTSRACPAEATTGPAWEGKETSLAAMGLLCKAASQGSHKLVTGEPIQLEPSETGAREGEESAGGGGGAQGGGQSVMLVPHVVGVAMGVATRRRGKLQRAALDCARQVLESIPETVRRGGVLSPALKDAVVALLGRLSDAVVRPALSHALSGGRGDGEGEASRGGGGGERKGEETGSGTSGNGDGEGEESDSSGKMPVLESLKVRVKRQCERKG